jgi:hypothetical protein
VAGQSIQAENVQGHADRSSGSCPSGSDARARAALWITAFVLAALGWLGLAGQANGFTLCKMCTQSLFVYSGDLKVQGQAFSSAAGDFNGDGIPDIAVTNDASVYVWLGQGGTHFGAPTTYPAGLGPRAVATGYLNNDKKLDLAVADRGSNQVQILFGDGSGGFGAPTGYSVGNYPVAIGVGNFNNDGHPDLAVVNQNDQDLSILLNNGSGGFDPHGTLDTGISQGPVTIKDFNGDGNPDILSGTLWLGNGHGGFTHSSALSGFGTVPGLAGDFNGDGKLDVAFPYGQFSGQYEYAYLGVQLGDGTGSFGPLRGEPAGGYTPTTGAVGDFNLDHSADAILGTYDFFNDVGGGAWMTLGGGPHGFDIPWAYPGGFGDTDGRTYSITVAKLNNDHEPDYIATGDSPYPTVAFNAGPHKPAVGGATPASPANDLTPLIHGAAEPGTVVRLYTNASCSGSPVAAGPAERFHDPGFQVNVAPNSTTTFNATTRYKDGRTSDCSRDPVPYVVDSDPPAPFSLVSPEDGASVGPHPKLIWQHTSDARSGMSHFEVRLDHQVVRRLPPGTNFYQPQKALTAGTHTWSVWAFDKAGNVRKSGGRDFRVR